MKKIILLLFLISTCAAFGQLKKGNMFLGGSLLFNPSKQEAPNNASTNKNMTLEVTPRYGYFISDHSVLGLALGYSHNKNTLESIGNSWVNKSSGFSFTPFYRRYYSLGEKTAFFVHGQIQAGFGKQNYSQTYFDGVAEGTIESKNDFFSIGAAIRPGFCFFPNPKWGLEVSFASVGYNYSNGYNYQNMGAGTKAKSNSFALNYSSFTFGVTYYINR